MKENEKIIDSFGDSVPDNVTWEDLKFHCGASYSAQSIQCPRKENVYNEPSISFYEDGTVWVSGAKGCVQMFKDCPYWLMNEIFKQRHNEVLGIKND